jgi:hypothetical protein
MLVQRPIARLLAAAPDSPHRPGPHRAVAPVKQRRSKLRILKRNTLGSFDRDAWCAGVAAVPQSFLPTTNATGQYRL